MNCKISIFSVVPLDNDGKASSSDLTTSENSTNPSLRAPQSSTHTGGKPIDVTERRLYFDLFQNRFSLSQTNDQPILIDGDDDDSDPPVCEREKDILRFLDEEIFRVPSVNKVKHQQPMEIRKCVPIKIVIITVMRVLRRIRCSISSSNENKYDGK